MTSTRIGCLVGLGIALLWVMGCRRIAPTATLTTTAVSPTLPPQTITIPIPITTQSLTALLTSATSEIEQQQLEDQNGHSAPDADNIQLQPVGQIGGQISAVAVQDVLAYIGVGYSLIVLDITNPQRPLEIGKLYPLPALTRDVIVTDNYAYVLTYKGMSVIDISTPDMPTEAGFIGLSGDTLYFTVEGNHVFVTTHDYGLHVIDISAPGYAS